jgi:Asp/Glu/hydantoin racemase
VGHDIGGVVVQGLESDTELYRVISTDERALDEERAAREVTERVTKLIDEFGVRCVIFECTNLSPYKSQVRSATGIAVFDLVDLVAFHRNALKG